MVNNDFLEDDCEDKNDGVDVQNEEGMKDPDENADDPMDLDADANLSRYGDINSQERPL